MSDGMKALGIECLIILACLLFLYVFFFLYLLRYDPANWRQHLKWPLDYQSWP